MNPGASIGRIPAKVLLAARASVTAGLANEDDAVNQYAAVMYAPTANGTEGALRLAQPQITASSPKVATNSLKSCEPPARTWVDAKNSGRSNMTCRSEERRVGKEGRKRGWPADENKKAQK